MFLFRLTLTGDNFDKSCWEYNIELLGDDPVKAMPATLADINMDNINSKIDALNSSLEELKPESILCELSELYEDYVVAIEEAADYGSDYPWYGEEAEDLTNATPFEEAHPKLNTFYAKAQDCLENLNNTKLRIKLNYNNLTAVAAYKEWGFFGDPIQLFEYTVPTSNLSSLRNVCVELSLQMGTAISSGNYRLQWVGTFTHCGGEYNIKIDCGYISSSNPNVFKNPKPGYTYDHTYVSDLHVAPNLTITKL